MKRISRLKSFAVGLAMFGLVIPAPVVQAADPIAPVAAMLPDTRELSTDVALQSGGTFEGVVLDDQGVAMAGVHVTISQRGQLIASPVTDAEGRYTVAGMQGGLYQVSAEGQASLVRLWNVGTAPPAAKTAATLIVSDQVIRGQRPLGEFFTSDAFVLTAIIAAAIAIPVAVHNSRDRNDDNGSGS